MPDHHSLAGVMVTIAALVLLLSVAALSWRLVERPAIALGHRSRY
jgi:peptidoglycan/LPS O-acetylase OafA/YrhL